MSKTKTISFYSRFEADILNGKKTITLRDSNHGYCTFPLKVTALVHEENRAFCQLLILNVSPLCFDDINDSHALQENMSLLELKKTIQEIYPGVNKLYEISFTVDSITNKKN